MNSLGTSHNIIYYRCCRMQAESVYIDSNVIAKCVGIDVTDRENVMSVSFTRFTSRKLGVTRVYFRTGSKCRK